MSPSVMHGYCISLIFFSRENIVKADIYFRDLSIKRVKQKEAYDVLAFFSKC